MFEQLVARGFEVHCVSHATAILTGDFPEAIAELEESLLEVDLPITEIIGSGGGEAQGTQRLRRSLAAKHWTKTTFEVRKTIRVEQEETPTEAISHEVDHVRTFAGRGRIALEIEWNNKDPFFDRDLENFKRLGANRGHPLFVANLSSRDYDSLVVKEHMRQRSHHRPHESPLSGFLRMQSRNPGSQYRSRNGGHRPLAAATDRTATSPRRWRAAS